MIGRPSAPDVAGNSILSMQQAKLLESAQAIVRFHGLDRAEAYWRRGSVPADAGFGHANE